MPEYEVVLIPLPFGGAEIAAREERSFANLGEALQTGREMYRPHQDRAAGFQIRNALGQLIHEWRP